MQILLELDKVGFSRVFVWRLQSVEDRWLNHREAFQQLFPSFAVVQHG